MKLFIVACAILVATQAMSDDDTNKMEISKKTCIKETGIDEDLVEQVHNGDYSSNDPKLNPFTFCVMKSIEIIDDSGNLVKDKIMAMVHDEDKNKAGEALEKCNAKLGAVTQDNAHEHCKCFHSYVPKTSMT